jgi:hypothetical protein
MAWPSSEDAISCSSLLSLVSSFSALITRANQARNSDGVAKNSGGVVSDSF